jgi:hypothetical protein
MSQVGFQDFWVAGSRAYFQKKAIEGVEQPWIDFGRLTSVNPTVTPEQVELHDPASGIRTLVDQGLTSITETYDIQTSNMSLENLSLLFLADEPTVFAQTAVEKPAIPHYAYPERLLKLIDNDADQTKLYAYDQIFGVVIPGDRITTAVGDVTAINNSTNTLTVTTDFDTTGIILAGDHIIVHYDGLANGNNARTYTVASTTTTTIVTVEQPQANEAAVTVDLTYKSNTSGTTGDVLKQAKVGTTEIGDWAISSEARGLITFSEDGLKFTTALYPTGATLNVYAHLGAILSRKRVFQPQDAKGLQEGTLVLIWSRNDNTDQTVREMEVSLAPSATAISDEAFSDFTLQAKVLSDLTADQPAGRVLQFLGTTPTQS